MKVRELISALEHCDPDVEVDVFVEGRGGMPLYGSGFFPTGTLTDAQTKSSKALLCVELSPDREGLPDIGPGTRVWYPEGQ